MSRLHVAVVRGGPSNEYDISLQSGASVLAHLASQPEIYQPYDVFIDKSGQWHVHGTATQPHEVFPRVDVVFNAMHGRYGEDGKLQQLLDHHRIPYTGSDALGAAVAMHKGMAKKAFKNVGLRVPFHITLGEKEVEEMVKAYAAEANPSFSDEEILTEALVVVAMDVFKRISLPVIIKPLSGGSSLGVVFVRSFDELAHALEKIFLAEHDEPVELMIEEYIRGTEATCGVIEDFRNEPLYALPPIEIRPHKGMIFDYDAKYAGAADEICPGHFTAEENAAIMDVARRAHEALGLRHYSGSDMIVTPRGIYVLETNSLPGLTGGSLLPKSLQAVGASLGHFVDHVLNLAMMRK